MFTRVLVANRGEIAVRIVRACRDLGLTSIVAYAEVDRESLAVRLADEAYVLQGDSPRAAYLDVEQLLELAQRIGAEAIHPGYGFLSENPTLSAGCRERGIVFVGPAGEVIATLGDKNQAREAMQKAGLPLVPGSDPLADATAAAEFAQQIGFPVLLKAAGGGGGRGMRLAHNLDEVASGFEQARRESLAAFGSDAIYIEKYIEQPRHIEIQILADQHDNVLYLHERECSVQRRFQKMLEEAPSPFLDAETRTKMGEAAVAGARDIGYRGAGTFEFLVDRDKNFYFLEVNTRLQVEHPVTEEITGIDIVEWQLRVAQGEKLPWAQEEIPKNGWSIECRITCEDPEHNFAPCPGKVTELRLPAGPGVRVDTHLFPGYTVPVDFDSMVGKLITWGADREQARRRMLGAIAEFRLGGFPNSLAFHQWLLQHPSFIAGDLSTHFLEEHYEGLGESTEEERALAALVRAVELMQQRPQSNGQAETPHNPWAQAGRWAGVAAGQRGARF